MTFLGFRVSQRNQFHIGIDLSCYSKRTIPIWRSFFECAFLVSAKIGKMFSVVALFVEINYHPDTTTAGASPFYEAKS